MRRIPEQCGPEPGSPIVGTSRLKAGGFFCRRRFRTVFCRDGVNWRKAASVALCATNVSSVWRAAPSLITLFYNGPVSTGVVNRSEVRPRSPAHSLPKSP